MIDNIEVLLGTAITLLGIAIPIIAKYYNRAQIYLSTLRSFMDMVDEVLKRKADGTIDDIDLKEIGRKTVTLVESIHLNDYIPLQLTNR